MAAFVFIALAHLARSNAQMQDDFVQAGCHRKCLKLRSRQADLLVGFRGIRGIREDIVFRFTGGRALTVLELAFDDLQLLSSEIKS
jgi:hypothetical protein